MVNVQASFDRTVVLIEDDEFIAAALCDLLELHGYRVVVATTARTVTAALAGGRGVVLLDPLVPALPAATVMRALHDGQALITIAVAVYPPSGRKPPPGKRRHGRRLISTDLLLEMVREAFGDTDGDPIAWAPPRAA